MDLGLIGYDAVSENVEANIDNEGASNFGPEAKRAAESRHQSKRCSVSGHCSERNGRQEIKKIYRRDYSEAVAPDLRFYGGKTIAESGAADCHIGAIVILNCQRRLRSNANFQRCRIDVAGT